MSLSTALSSAMTGITAAGRSTSVVSDNLANALTEGITAGLWTLAPTVLQEACASVPSSA